MKKLQQLRGTQFIPKESCVTPNRDRGQVKPHVHKQLFKFQRIKCTICSTRSSTPPETKVTTPAGKRHAWCLLDLLLSEKIQPAEQREFLIVRNGFRQEETESRGSQGTTGTAGLRKMVHNRKAVCCTLLKRITRLKVSIL